MKRKLSMTVLLVLLFGVAAAASSSPDQSTVKGEIIQVEQQVRSQNAGEFNHLRIRTRQGEEMRLQLGKANGCPGCFQAGDQIRARVRTGDAGQAAQVQSIQVRRNGNQNSYRFENGALTRDRSRLRSRDGGGTGAMNRKQWRQNRSADGTCRGVGGARQGSGAGGAGNSRGGGEG